jgi:hypothetical protein
MDRRVNLLTRFVSEKNALNLRRVREFSKWADNMAKVEIHNSYLKRFVNRLKRRLEWANIKYSRHIHLDKGFLVDINLRYVAARFSHFAFRRSAVCRWSSTASKRTCFE